MGKEKTVIDNPDTYGYVYNELSIEDKIRIILDIKKFDRGTYKDSWCENEFIIINDKIGMHWTGFKFVYNIDYTSSVEVVETFGIPPYKEVTRYHYGELKDATEDNIKLLLDCLSEKQLEEYNAKLKEKEEEYKKNTKAYYEVSSNRGLDMYFYTECGEDCYSLEIGKKSKLIYLNGVELFTDNYDTCLYMLLELIYNNINIFNGIQNLSNGIVWNNKYYENKKELLLDIENMINKNKLECKLPDGLCIDDL